MLKLKKIHILGFKSFCDRTDLTVAGTGVAVVVGPNGCGKSNILDAVSWVLGEQSAKTLRGANMQDVIFAGSHARKPLGMAEVSLTMIDPAAYEGPIPVEPEIDVDSDGPADWDEEQLRRARALETEEIVASEQPGQALDGEGDPPAATPADDPYGNGAFPPKHPAPCPSSSKSAAASSSALSPGAKSSSPAASSAPAKANTSSTASSAACATFRTSSWAPASDPESYAIIGQERIGQLLSSKPHDRRAVIEEAAGITRFKTRKRLAELRLESAKQNLARIDDIFEEVTRQMNSLKRQAAKAERFAAVRDELRSRLRVVLASRMALMDADQARLDAEIAALTGQINASAAQIGESEAGQHAMTERGYELDGAIQEAQSRAGNAAVEIERAAARERANIERVGELEARIAATAAEIEQTRAQLNAMNEERAQQRSFLETAAEEARAFHLNVSARQQEARNAADEVFNAERDLEANRRRAMHLLTLAGNARNSTAQAEESLAALEREADRLEAEMRQSHLELENLGVESGQARLNFDSATERLQIPRSRNRRPPRKSPVSPRR